MSAVTVSCVLLTALPHDEGHNAAQASEPTPLLLLPNACREEQANAYIRLVADALGEAGVSHAVKQHLVNTHHFLKRYVVTHFNTPQSADSRSEADDAEAAADEAQGDDSLVRPFAAALASTALDASAASSSQRRGSGHA